MKNPISQFRWLQSLRISIRWKMIFAIGIPLLVIYVGAASLIFSRLKQSAYLQTEAHLKELVLYHAEKINSKFSVLAAIAQSNATFLELNPDLSEEAVYRMLESTVLRNPLVYGACTAFEPYAFDPARELVAPYVWRGKDEDAGTAPEKLMKMDVARDAYNYLDWNWYVDPKKLGHPVWTEPFFDEGAGDIMMTTHTVPFRKNGKFWGVTTIDVHIAKLQQWGAVEGIGGERFVLVSRAGRFVSHPNPDFIMKKSLFDEDPKMGDPELKEAAQRILRTGTGLEHLRDFPFPGRNFIVYAQVESTGWIFLAAVREAVIMKPVWRQLAGLTLLMGASLLGILAILFTVSFFITSPIRQLAKELQVVGRGDLEIRKETRYPRDEIGDLASTFHRMVEALKEYLAALTRETTTREAVESELRIARSIQSSLLPNRFPAFPERSELDLFALNVPARYVAGDFYDFFFISPEELAVAVADVSGKGMPAAMFMAVTRTLLRSLAAKSISPSEVFEKTSRLLFEQNEQGIFVSATLAYYHTRTGRLSYTNAGHPRPYVKKPSGELRRFGEITGTVLGILDDAAYETREEVLAPGETILFFTDGVTEARNTERLFFGESRLEASFSQTNGTAARDICTDLYERIQAFQGPSPADDITLLALRRND
ncbi:MAG TPA: SpoIIE family protein phosphatase [bacterium]|nr:SpoIIE family protein phosphatase [bacterium]